MRTTGWEDFILALTASECAKLYPGTNLVIGRGSQTPRVVFIGEAPGAEEDRLCTPFVGRSGQMLDSWIRACNLQENEYYICNVMKTRPPQNRNPTPEEIATCAPWLAKQLAVLKPQIVVAVGRFAVKHFLPKEKSILQAAGQVFDSNGTRVFVIPHPSYFIRRGGKGWEPYVEALRVALNHPTLTTIKTSA